MLHNSFKPAKCKTSLKLAISRIKLLKNKKDVQIKQLKGDLAKFLETGQDQTARIRVEHLMREVRTKAAYEFIEIYCELIVARLPIIELQKNCPLDLKEAIASVIFASPRCADIPELMDVSKQFTAKYGKDFMLAATELRPECGVNRMLVDKLSARAPDGPTKIKILSAIAKEYNVKWESKVFEEKFAMPPTDLLNGPSTFEKASRIQMEPIQMEPIELHPVYHDYKEPLNIRFPPQPDKNHNKPAVCNLQNPVSAPHSQKSSSSNITVNSGAYSPAVRPPEIADARTEFKDATSTAQAAVESAERTRMAARAAAELASRGKITAKRSSNSLNSSVYKLKDEKHQEFSHSNLPKEHIPKDTLSTAAYRGCSMSGDHPSFKDAKISSTADDWDTKKWINDKPLADKFEVANKYPEMMSSEPDMNNPSGRSTLEEQYTKSEREYVNEQPGVVESEGGLNIERVGKESCNDNVILDDSKSVSNPAENPFASDDLDEGGVATETSFHVNGVVYDESTSDDNYDLVSKDQTRESGFNPLLPDRKSLKNSSSMTDPWDPIRIVPEEPPLFSESSNSTDPSQTDNLLPMTFDSSDGSTLESEEEIEESKLNQDSGKYFSKQNVAFINPELSQNRSFKVARSSKEENFDYDDLPRAINSVLDVNRSRNFGSPKPSEEEKSEYSNSSKVVKSNFNVSNDADTVDDSDSEEDLFIQIDNKPGSNIGVSVRTKGTSFNTASSSRSPSTPEYVNERMLQTRRSPEPSSTNEIRTKEQPSMSLANLTAEKATDSPISTRGETPSSGKCSHVHPKLPNYDSFAAHFMSLQKNG